METVPPADSPPRYNGDDDLGHESNEALNLEDVESPQLCGVDALGPLVFVSIFASDALVAARAERPTPILGRWPVSCDQDTSHI
jgi:hypothetical protein